MQDHEAGGTTPQYTADQLASRDLDSYTTLERLAWVANYPSSEVGFIPSGRSEASTAFRYLFHAANSGTTTAEYTQGIRMSQMLRAGVNEQVTSGDFAVMSAANSQGAYARQAYRDARWLRTARQQLEEHGDLPGEFANAGDFFAAALPMHAQGSGQLVRFIDSRRMVEEQKKPNNLVMKGRTAVRSGVTEVVDEYTQGQSGEMRDHIAEVLQGVSLAELDELLVLAEQNEMKRLSFWTAHLEDMRTDPSAKSAATRALRAVGATL